MSLTLRKKQLKYHIEQISPTVALLILDEPVTVSANDSLMFDGIIDESGITITEYAVVRGKDNESNLA